MKVAYVKDLMISGHSTTTNNQNETNDETAKIPQLWEEYDSLNIYSKTFNKAKSSNLYATYTNYQSDENGDYDVTIGVEVTKPKNAIVIKDERYLVFSKKGELPDIVVETWNEITEYFSHKPEYERKFSIDFEKYAKEDEIEIYISIH